MTEPAAMTIGQRIARERKRLGLSQEALGEALGVSRQAISKWEADASLPEIDKLIAMARCFGVTVGWLLGVEESREEDGPGGAEPSVNSETEARAQALLERCLEALPAGGAGKLPRKTRRALIAGGAAVALCLALLLGRVGALGSQLNTLRSQMSSLNDQLYTVQYQIGDMTGTVVQQVQDTLLASWEMTLASVDYDAEEAVLVLEGVPKQAVDGPEELLFSARLADGTVVTAQETQLDGAGGFTARMTLPLENGIEYYLQVGDQTTWLSQTFIPYTNLYSATSVECYPSVSDGGETANGKPVLLVTLDVTGPELIAGEQAGAGPDSVRLWSVVDGRRLEELELEEAEFSTAGAVAEGYWSAGPYQATCLIDPEELFLARGSQFWVEYEVSYSGKLWTGESDVLLTWGGADWA